MVKASLENAELECRWWQQKTKENCSYCRPKFWKIQIPLQHIMAVRLMRRSKFIPTAVKEKMLPNASEPNAVFLTEPDRGTSSSDRKAADTLGMLVWKDSSEEGQWRSTAKISERHSRRSEKDNFPRKKSRWRRREIVCWPVLCPLFSVATLCGIRNRMEAAKMRRVRQRKRWMSQTRVQKM